MDIKSYLVGGAGGSLSLFYQSQAENLNTETPAGDPIDLISEKFIPADAVMLITALNLDIELLLNGLMAQ